jgi:hypothetical protein
MLDHQKLLLEKVSNDRELFRKEIVKSFKWLKSYEIIQLHKWLKEKFGKTHHEIITEIFQYIAA